MTRHSMMMPCRTGAAAFAVCPARWMARARRLGFGVVAILAIAGSAGQAADERFEVASIKAVRPTLVDTVAALQQRDVARAKAAFAAYDSAWNGIEVYINTRNKEMYNVLELDYQRKIAKALDAATPDTAALLADAQDHARQI